MVMEVADDNTEDLPARSILRNANRKFSVFGAGGRQKPDPRHGPNAKPLYHGFLDRRSRLGRRKFLRNDSISSSAILKHLGSGGASTWGLSHNRMDREQEGDAKNQLPSKHLQHGLATEVDFDFKSKVVN